MIAAIDNKRDIEVFLNPIEIAAIENNVIDGVIITNLLKPKQQGKLVISVNQEKSRGNPNGIHVMQEKGVFELFINNICYHDLKENGIIGVRYDICGSKVSLYDISRHRAATCEHLEFYRDNKDKLLPEFG